MAANNTKIRKIEPNVWTFLQSASALYGRIEAEAFSQQMHVGMVERGIESPIEDMVYIALHLQCRTRLLSVNEGPNSVDGSITWGSGIQIAPQKIIGSYRVDFLVSNNHGASVIVELDGHAFHDKDKKQRSYEKARDRFFVKAGYQVLHYTGSDVVSDPYRVAYEVLEVLELLEGGESYDPANPVGIN